MASKVNKVGTDTGETHGDGQMAHRREGGGHTEGQKEGKEARNVAKQEPHIGEAEHIGEGEDQAEAAEAEETAAAVVAAEQVVKQEQGEDLGVDVEQVNGDGEDEAPEEHCM